MAISSLTNGTSPLASVANSLTSPASGSAAPAAGFGDMVKNMIEQSANAASQSENLQTQVAQGQSVPLNDVIQAVSKAELTLETLITVRDRAVEAYQQIQQMPI